MNEQRNTFPISLPERVSAIEATLKHLVTKTDLIEMEHRMRSCLMLILVACFVVVVPILLYIAIQLHIFLS